MQVTGCVIVPSPHPPIWRLSHLSSPEPSPLSIQSDCILLPCCLVHHIQPLTLPLTLPLTGPVTLPAGLLHSLLHFASHSASCIDPQHAFHTPHTPHTPHTHP
jgi:hypothetical protein